MSAIQKYELTLEDLEYTKKMCTSLMQTGHYKKLGEVGIFSVLQMAKALGIDATQALNGGLYPIDGKIEMDGKMMMSLIRQAGHSIIKDPKSTRTHCILHGRRADNGDTWTEEFGMEDAKRAGLLGKGNYEKWGKDMFQWRALSPLARFLFADVIKGCYIRGEIEDSPKFHEKVDIEKEEAMARKIEIEINPERSINEQGVNIHTGEITLEQRSDDDIANDFSQMCRGLRELDKMSDYLDVVTKKLQITVVQFMQQSLNDKEKFVRYYNIWLDQLKPKKPMDSLV